MENKKLRRFLVKLTAVGFSESEAQSGLADLQSELIERNLINPQICWIDGKLSINVEIELEGVDANKAGLIVYDDLFEAIFSTMHFSSEEGMRFSIPEVNEIN